MTGVDFSSTNGAYQGESISAEKHIELSTVTGFFMQDDPHTNPETFDYTKTNFGLIDRVYDTDEEFDPEREKTQWQRFGYYVESLNDRAPKNIKYKLIYMGRHGEGYHNVAEAKHGTHDWDCYYSFDPKYTDADLTQKGIDQAKIANAFWHHEIEHEKIPVPQYYYTSPLARCLKTAETTYQGLDLPPEAPFIPEIKELVRECIGIHTCDMRSTRSWIHNAYPSWIIEPGFAEEDPLWEPDKRESVTMHIARLKTFLDDIFNTDRRTFLSFTSHSGSIASMLAAVKHQTFGLQTGALIPVLIKAEWKDGPAPPFHVDPPLMKPVCDGFPPVEAPHS